MEWSRLWQKSWDPSKLWVKLSHGLELSRHHQNQMLWRRIRADNMYWVRDLRAVGMTLSPSCSLPNLALLKDYFTVCFNLPASPTTLGNIHHWLLQHRLLSLWRLGSLLLPAWSHVGTHVVWPKRCLGHNFNWYVQPTFPSWNPGCLWCSDHLGCFLSLILFGTVLVQVGAGLRYQMTAYCWLHVYQVFTYYQTCQK